MGSLASDAKAAHFGQNLSATNSPIIIATGANRT